MNPIGTITKLSKSLDRKDLVLSLKQYEQSKSAIQQQNALLMDINNKIQTLQAQKAGDEIVDSALDVEIMNLQAQQQSVISEINKLEFDISRAKIKLDKFRTDSGQKVLKDYSKKSFSQRGEAASAAADLVKTELLAVIGPALLPLAVIGILLLCFIIMFKSLTMGGTTSFDMAANCKDGVVNEECKNTQDSNAAERVYNSESCGSYGNACENI